MPSSLRRVAPNRRELVGAAVSVALVMAFAALLLPLRSHMSVATTALVLVVPVVVGAAIGGLAAGLVGTVAGFVAFDVLFVPPYYALTVGPTQDWVALGVYVAVTFVVAQVVARLDAARTEAERRAEENKRLFDLSELLVRESRAPELLDTIVTAVRQAFELDGAALLLPAGESLQLAASVGAPLSSGELHQLSTRAGVPVKLGTAWTEHGGVQAVVLTTSGRAIGLLALRGLKGNREDRDLVQAFANHLALALERSRLREQALRA
jgi:two-component system sensor histidine kinase KdpD